MLKEITLEKSERELKLQLPSMIIAVGASMLTAYSTLGGMTSPLNCALTAVLPPVYTAAVFVGSIAVYLASGGLKERIVTLFAMLLITIGRRFMRGEETAALRGGLTAVCYGASGVILGLLGGSGALTIMTNIVLGLAAGISVYFLHNTAEFISRGKPLRLDGKAEMSAAAVYMLAVTVLCSAGISVINVGRIAGTAAVLCAAKRFRQSGGVIFGVLTTAGIFLNSPKLGLPAVFLGVAGFAAGFASNYSRVSVAAMFLTVNLLGQFLTGMNDASFFLQADVIIGCAAFMIVPERVLMYGQVIRGEEDDGNGRIVKARMDFVAETLVDVRRSMEDIIKCLEKNIVPFNTINEVSERVCSKCRNKVRCWENSYEKTNACFLKLEKQSPAVTPESFPGALDHCVRKAEISECFMRCRKEDAINKMLSARLIESRSILFSQMETTEGILSSLSDKMNFSYSKSLTQALCGLLEDEGLEFTTAIAYFSRSERLIAEVYVKELTEDFDGLAELMSDEFHIPMEAAEPVSCGSETRLRFSRRTKYAAEFAAQQKSACEGQPSGDSWGFFEDGLGYTYIFISDGMGSGRQAALDSAIVSRLFKRLIRSGIDCESAVKMLNSIMLTKSGEESFATLDIARIDLETCELTLFKSGASSTLIKYDDAVMMFNSPSNPIGIIPDSQLFSRTCSFAQGNILVMLSDGVDESLYRYIKEQLLRNGNLEEIAENVCRCADKNSRSALRDDITVAVLRLAERT